MEQVLIVTDTTSGDAFAIVTEKAGSLRFFGMSEPGKEWSKWLDAQTSGRGRLDQIVKKLSIGLSADGPKPMNRKVRSQIAENLPKVSESTHEELTTGRVDSKSLNRDGQAGGSEVSSAGWNALINYKAMSFISDQNIATIAFDLKSIRAVFDPDLAGGNGGYRCPPGVRFGGQITDRYGRGCGVGVTRRIVNAVGDAARRVEGRLDDRRKRRVDRRNRNVGRSIGSGKPGRSRRGMATRLDDFADRRDRRQGRGIATRLDDFADRRDERQGVSPRNRRGAGSPPAVARRRRSEELVDEPAPQTARERRRSASVDRVNDQPTAAKKPATVPAVEQEKPVKKVAAKKRAVKKVPAKKAPAKKKAAAKKAPAKKAVAKKSPAKKAAAKKAAARPPSTSTNSDDGRIPDFLDLNEEDRRWALAQVDARHRDDGRLVANRIAKPNANLQADIEKNERQIEQLREVLNNPELDDRVRVVAAGRIVRIEANNRRFQEVVKKNQQADPPGNTVPLDSGELSGPNRLDKVEKNLNAWVERVADSEERREVIEAFRAKENELLRLAAAVPTEGVAGLEREAEIYGSAIRKLKKRDLPAPEATPVPSGPIRGLPGFADLEPNEAADLKERIKGLFGTPESRVKDNAEVIKVESIEALERRIAYLENELIPDNRRIALDVDKPLVSRVWSAELLAITEERVRVYKEGLEKKRAAQAAVPDDLIDAFGPERLKRLEKDVADRYANLRKKRGGIVGKWMVKTYGNEDPPPWLTDKNIKIEELKQLVARRNPEDMDRIKEWVQQVYGIQEVVGRNGLRFRVQIPDGEISLVGSQIVFSGSVQAFNPDTNAWESIGKVDREIRPNGGLVYNARLMLGAQGGYDNPFANAAKNEGFTSVFNPHAFTWLKASGFDRAEVSAAADGRFVWGRFGYRQNLGENRGNNLANALMIEVEQYRGGRRDGLIRTDLDADLIEYLTNLARQKNFTIDAPQHPEYILALAGDANFTEEQKKAYDKKLQNWFVAVAPFGSGVYDFNDQNVPDDPRKLV